MAGSRERRRPALVACAVGALLVIPAAAAASQDAAMAVEAGRALAFDRDKGNCLACHAIPGGESPGDIGPPLVGLRERYPDRAALRARIWDPSVANPATLMPPFGRNRVLTEAEIGLIVDFLLTL